MKCQFARLFTFGAVIAIGSSTVIAGPPGFWHSCGIDRERNNAWPQPFRSADAAAVYAPFDIMKTNGWKLFNTIGTCFFNENHSLTDAGRLRVEWIVFHAPQERRQVFVMRGVNAETTAARVEAVQVAISQMLPTGDLPLIYVTDVEPTASSGQYQTAINRAMNNTQPNPRLPVFKGLNAPSSNSSGGGGGGGGGSGSGGSSK